MTITLRPNGGTIRALLTIAGILIVAWASAQNRRTFDLEKDYGVTPFTADLEIRHQHASPAAAKAAYPALFARLNGLGWSDAKVMQMNIYPAAWNDAVLRGQGGGQPITGRVTSNNDIQAPAGSYPIDYPCVVDGGRYIGKGTGWTGPGSDSQNTELRLDRAGWLGNVAEMHLIQSSTWGMLSGSNSYFEGCYISDFRLTGDSQGRWHDSGYESAGLALWDMGETGKVERIYSNTFNGYGVLLVRSTPATIDVVSLFQNSIAGVGVIGADLATIRFGTVSGDDNPSLFRVRPGYGREGGGAIEVACIKSESGKRTPIKGQIVLDAVGYVGFNAGTVSVAADFELIDALFVVETRGVNATVNVGNLRGYGYATLVQDVTNKKRWASPGNYRQLSFNWNSLSGGTFTSTAAAPQSACNCPGRLGTAKFVNGAYQTFDYSACTPKYDITGGTTPTPPDPVSCVWTCTDWGPWSDWGPCVDGEQQRSRTRTCTTGPAGCIQDTPSPIGEEWEVALCAPDPDTCAWTCGDWGPCVSGIRTRTCTSNGHCTANDPLPDTTLPCSAPPPPSGIDPADVTVIVNTADPSSAAMGAAYASAWGIPVQNIVQVNAGSGHSGNMVQANALRNAAQVAGREFTALAMAYPSRIGEQSVTSFVTFGPLSVSSLTKSPLFGYTGLKPRSTIGVAPSWILLSEQYIRKDAHRTTPGGTAYAIYANDGSTPIPAARGNARKGQAPSGVEVWDNTTGRVGKGENPCNWLSNDCWVRGRTPVDTVIAAYQSMYKLGSDGGIAWAHGFYGDHVTSLGGYLDGNDPNGKGQTPLTYHLDRGASFSVGSVAEPWQGSGGSLAVQFVNIEAFHPAFIGGVPVGIAAWSAVQAPGRMLMAGDGMCAPFME